MSLIRPEAKAELWRWREVGAGIALLALGLWLVQAPGWLLAVPGGALVLAALALIWLGVQRGRFRGPGGGPGAVQIDEGQVSYFGPLTGGTLALRDLDRLVLEGSLFPPHWRLEQAGQAPLLIPVNAAGAEALFDAFAALPGLRTEHMLARLREKRHQAVVIWQRDLPGSVSQLIH